MRSRQKAQFWVGLVIFVGIIVTAIFAQWIAPHSFEQQNLRAALRPPVWMENGTWDHPLGTDRLGRDLLSRLIYGARVSTAVGVFSVLLGGTLGTIIGLIAGYYQGWVDGLISRLIDIQLSFPPVFIAIAIMAAVGQTLTNLIIVLAFVTWVQYARVARGSTMALRNQEFVLAARSVGARSGRILLRHLLPSLLPTLAVIAAVNMSSMILAEAALSFLGLGVQPPTPAWGSMVSEARGILSLAWWNAVFPGLAIALFVTGTNLMGDGLRR
ncbi:ABC transporter permease subunit [bacterium]|nr:ABC transporter permease subunit [bacterium]